MKSTFGGSAAVRLPRSGDGIAPVISITQKLTEKQYTGVLSVELFRPDFVQGNPFEVAMEIRQKCEAVMRRASVL